MKSLCAVLIQIFSSFRYDQQQQQQPGVGSSMMGGQPMRPPSQQPMTSQGMPNDQMYPGRYQQMGIRPHTPQEQYGGAPNQQVMNTPQGPQGGYPTPQRPYVQGQECTPQGGYPNQQGPQPQSQPVMYQGQKGPQMQYPGQKRYPDFPERRDGYNMPPGYQQGGGQQGTYASDRSQYPPYSPQQPPRSHLGGAPDGGMHNDMRSAAGRDQQQWSPMQHRYPPNSSASYGPSTAMSQQMAPSSANVPPYPGMMIRNRMSPQRMDKGQYYSPQKMQKSGSLPHNAFPPKKEIVFPSDSVEAVQPLLQKRKRITAKDVNKKGPVDAWKIMMALKSGLLAESTWALDMLSILLFDDSTIIYFGLKHLPGLLEVLVDHLRNILIIIFGDEFTDLQIQTDVQKRALRSERKSHKKQRRESCTGSPTKSEGEQDISLEELNSEDEEEDMKEEEDEFADIFGATSLQPPDKKNLEEPGNYTMKTRYGLTVKIETDSEGAEYVFDEKKWDKCTGFSSSEHDWKRGKGDMTSHVLTHMEHHDILDIYRQKFYGPNRYHIKKELSAENNTVPSAAATQVPSAAATQVPSAAATQVPSAAATQVQVEKAAADSSTDTPSTGDSTNSTDTVAKPVEDSSSKVDDKPQSKNASSPASEPVIKQEDSHQLSNSVSCSSLTSASNASSYTSSSNDTDIRENSSNTSDTSAAVVVKTEPKSPELHPPETRSCHGDDIGETKMECSDDSEKDLFKQENGGECKTENRTKLPTVSRCTDYGSLALEGLKRKWEDNDQEYEAYQHDKPPLCLISESRDELSRRCICISNILRSLSFVPGNEVHLSKHYGLILVLGKLLLVHHRHPKRKSEQRSFDREESGDSHLEEKFDDGTSEWWWDTLDALRENTLVIFANMCGQLNLSLYPEEICMPMLDGLLHWAVCHSAYAGDPMPTMSAHSVLSPQRLVLEALCKLCVLEGNVDLLLATPPFSRIVQLFQILVNLLADRKEQVMREFGIVLLSSLVQGGSAVARAIALQHPSISLLLDFLETAEHQALQIANSHGVDMLRDNPEMMGTSLDMLRRAATTLSFIAMVPENRALFVHQQDRLLQLVMSQILDQKVAAILSDVLYNCSLHLTQFTTVSSSSSS